VLALAALIPAGTAQAASSTSGDLSVSIEWVDLSGAVVTDLVGTESSKTNVNDRLVGLRIGYSCGPAACPGTAVAIAPMSLDPYYGTQRFASFDSVTLPAGATRTGSAAAGYQIALGNLAAGTSGSFTMLYNYQNRPTFPAPQSFFPEGFQPAATATISSPGRTSTSATERVTWHIATPEPVVAFFPLADQATGVLAPARVDAEYTYTMYMTSGCIWNGGGNGEPMFECADSYTAVQTLPPGAVFVSASHGGEYDGAGHVTWTAAGQSAGIGWGRMTVGAQARTVVVRFPAAIVTDPAACVLTLDTTLAVDVTYLSGATDSATTTKPQTVNGCRPFAAGSGEKFSSSSFATGTSETVVWAGSNQQWTVRAYNRSNVPARGTITDTFDQAGLPVTRIQSVAGAADITATLDDGQTVVTTTADYTAPSGRRIVQATVVTPVIAGPNVSSADQSQQNYVAVRFHYTVTSTVPSDGFERTNIARVVLSFPENPELGTLDAGNRAATVLVTPRPARFSPTLTASVAGGGNPVAGTIVTYTGGGTMSDQDAGVDFEPQYVFVAPAGWTVVPGSAAIPGLADEEFEYTTVTIDGVARQAVFAQRPAGTVWGVNQTWPAMTVQATPGAGVPANTNSTATFYMGDARHTYGPRSAIWGSQSGNAWGAFRYVDAADLDGDGIMTESFAYTGQTLRVGASSGLNVLKEICLPDASQPDGCAWASDPDSVVTVSPDTTGIRYRITIENSATTPLTGVVAYDVLPHPGDVSLTPAATPRGSTFTQALHATPPVSGATLAYSAQTNPCRPEVYVAAPGCVDDWAAAAVGATAMRITVPGTLAPGASAVIEYLADVVGTPAANALACNSVAVGSASTPVTEPRPVCAMIASADLEASSPATLATQLGRPAIAPFSFTNLAGTDGVPATVRIAIPAGISVTDLSIAGWACDSATPAPVEGPVDIECTVSDPLGLGDVVELPLPILVGAVGVSLTATIGSGIFDPVAGNNATTIALDVAVPVPSGISVTKSDGVSVARAGDELSYVITVTNELLYEPLSDVAVIDTLPAGLDFVAATDGGVESAGVVEWLIPAIPGGGTVTVTVTTRLAGDAGGSVVNTVEASAVDPAFGVTLSDTAEDSTSIAVAPQMAETGSDLSSLWPAALLLIAGILLLGGAGVRRRLG
jgi:uncharacterized repeat protein (TIGR01451 family)